MKATVAEGLLAEAKGSAWRPKKNDRDGNMVIISNGLHVHNSQVGVLQDCASLTKRALSIPYDHELPCCLRFINNY